MQSHVKKISRFAVVENKVDPFLAVKLNVAWKFTVGFGIDTHREARVPFLPSSTSSTTKSVCIMSTFKLLQIKIIAFI